MAKRTRGGLGPRWSRAGGATTPRTGALGRFLKTSSALLGLTAGVCFSGTATAQTWIPPRSTPVVPELIAVDATGEEGWLFGAEDVAGDGLDTFLSPERAIDLRTVYAATDGDVLWIRSYVSGASAPGDNLSLFVFFDTDDDPDTGGSAAAPALDARFDADPTEGGYELVAAVEGSGELLGTWEWSENDKAFVASVPPLATLQVELGEDVDPILIHEAEHGYLQFSIVLDEIDLGESCRAGIFVRSVNDTESLGAGDLNVGARTHCRPNTGNGPLPDVLVPRAECTDDTACPGDGLCIDGSCFIPPTCSSDDDCQDDEVCSAVGYCTFDASTATCDDDDDCDDLICDTGESLCAACTDDVSCGDGRRCASTGRCVDGDDVVPPSSGGTGGTTGGGGAMGAGGTATGGSATGGGGLEIGDDETVQGGAFTCRWGGTAEHHRSAMWMSIVAFALMLVERRRRTSARSQGALDEGLEH